MRRKLKMINKKQTVGQKLSPILVEIEDALWDVEADNPDQPQEFPVTGVRAAIKIFMAVINDKMWSNPKFKLKPMAERMKMAEKAGKECRAFVKKYVGIDKHDLYKI